ncbi:MAG: bifunctional phosphopantothenoylcysteine decarboxylase/phosphopantothenate--cysteine ligase CoaBC [Marinilabiliaceae bacterium]|nr:bifunctional phosphopantothenoylcysteine decarboxylase/phosphopantothenate--cysteine ligase CoaBC [Marinilabiliaceae bacterium]
MLKGKKIIVGVCGGIAAYKTAYLVREIVKQGGEVRVVMTQMAKQFITPLTMATLSKNPIMVDFFDPENGAWNSHVGLGTWADAMVIAPATANTIAKMANGIADNLLLTTYLSARCPIIIAPTMDLDMYAHPATQQNIDLLKQRGVVVVDPDAGELASGLSGKGRMAEPESIAETIDDVLAQIDTKLKGKRIMVTAGPTYERIDPVRFIGNYSSGKMGYAIAEELAKRGAIVELISGPVKIAAKRKNIIVTKTESAAEMYAAACEIFPKCKGAIMSAAVADFTPSQCADSKIKNKQTMQITLVPTPDIAAAMGKMKQKTQFLVGFALETDHEEINALEKLQKKNLDFIVLNSLRDAGAGFMTDTNKVTIYHRDGVHIAYELKPKAEVASDIVNSIERYIND